LGSIANKDCADDKAYKNMGQFSTFDKTEGKEASV